jgi:hypothetical protein
MNHSDEVLDVAVVVGRRQARWPWLGTCDTGCGSRARSGIRVRCRVAVAGDSLLLATPPATKARPGLLPDSQASTTRRRTRSPTTCTATPPVPPLTRCGTAMGAWWPGCRPGANAAGRREPVWWVSGRRR